jgi:hypothetical protein
MRRALLGVVVCCLLGAEGFAARRWQAGTWRESQIRDAGGSVSIPIAGIYFNLPDEMTVQTVTIEGPDGMLYVASRTVKRLWPVIINDPVPFAIEDDRLYTRGNGTDPKKEMWFRLVKRIRPEPGQ